MSLILNKAQAEAVLNAMSHLNNVGAVSTKTSIPTKTHRVSVCFGVGLLSGVYVRAVTRTTRPAVITEESYDSQAAFAVAYGLN
jgi:hypothetical protein